MMTWKQGRRLLNASCARMPSTSDFLESVHQPRPGGRHGRFSDGEPGAVPNALLHNLKHNKVLHEQNLFVTVRNHEVPWIGLDKRCRWSRWGMTAGRWWCTTASRTTLTCRVR
jgi:KUP system potassium uptake protein